MKKAFESARSPNLRRWSVASFTSSLADSSVRLPMVRIDTLGVVDERMGSLWKGSRAVSDSVLADPLPCKPYEGGLRDGSIGARGQKRGGAAKLRTATPVSPSPSMSFPVTFSARLTADLTRLLIGICA